MKTNQKPEDGYYKSSSSKAAGCVEVKFADGQVAVRDFEEFGKISRWSSIRLNGMLLFVASKTVNLN